MSSASDNNNNNSSTPKSPPSSGSRWGPRRIQAPAPDVHMTEAAAPNSAPSSNNNSKLPDDDSHVVPNNGNDSNPRKRELPTASTLVSSSHADMSSSHTIGAAIPEEQYLSNFELLTDVEWGLRRDENGYDSDQELAPRPKITRTAEMCACETPPEGLQFTCRYDSCENYACREECNTRECGPHCGNQRLTRRQFKKVQVFDAGPKGYGLRVLEDCVKGDIIQEYTGMAVREGFLEKLFRRYEHERRLYIMQLDDKVYLDARKKGGLARYINHSCNPNCKVEKWRVKGIFRMAVVALQSISSGTELTFDYQWKRNLGRAPTKCHCGEPSCRGTLEIPKSVEEIQAELLESGRCWISPKHKRADERIVNRTIRIEQRLGGGGAAKKDNHDDGDGLHDTDDEEDDDDDDNGKGERGQSFFVMGEVTEYNPETKLHKILYPDLTEKWENLQSEKTSWMILEEEQSPTRTHSIARKAHGNVSSSADTSKTEGASLLKAFSSAKDGNQQPQFLFIQTPVKEAIFPEQNRSFREMLERKYGVTFLVNEFSKPPFCDDTPEEKAKWVACEQSLDGRVWRIHISGGDNAKALEAVTKKVQATQKRQHDDQQPSTPRPGAAAVIDLVPTAETPKLVDEVIFPRSIAEHVKRRLPLLRERCRNVSLQIMPSESKSKQIARLMLDGALASDVQNARVQIRNAILAICKELPPNDLLSMVSINNQGDKIPRDFGFLGGSLTKKEFEALLLNSSKSNGLVDSTTALLRSKHKESSFAGLDLNRSPYFATFESNYGPIWIQSEDDMGRISNHQLVGDANSTDTRKVYFGCDPEDLNARWELIHKRAQDAIRGVRFLFLGTDQIFFLRFLMQSGFFNYVAAATGATVGVDNTTGNHLRIDAAAKSSSARHLSVRVNAMSEEERADLAEELVRLQIEVYRDQFTRKHSWIFGRDWTTVNVASDEPAPDNMRSFGKLDSRSAPQSCSEMADVVAHLDLPGSVAAHAAIILYRFVSLISETQMKARDAVLACVFIANKSQKAKKWRRLEQVLEAGYKAFYPGTKFDAEKEEVLKLEQRVIDAEQELLNTLQYDVFVPDTDNLEQMISELPGNIAGDVVKFAFGGQLLGAGASLWLKYGLEYIFAACAAVLKADLKGIVSSLELIPLKVSQTLNLIVENARYGKPTNSKVPSHQLLEGNKSHLTEHTQRINQYCVQLTSEISSKGNRKSEYGGAMQKRFKEIGKANLRSYAIRGVPHQTIEDHVLQHIDGIEAESGCSIFLSPSQTVGDDDIIIQGPWRAVAIADFILRSTAESLPVAEDAGDTAEASSQLQVKTRAGLIDAREICTSGGWSGTVHPLGSKDLAERQLGGKSCVAGKISADALRHSGLRWWFRQTKGSSQSGTFTEMFSIRTSGGGGGDKLEELADLFSTEDKALFPVLSSFRPAKGKPKETTDDAQEDDLFVAVSLQRWPSERVSLKEDKRSRKSKRRAMGIGFSAGALQEMQLLTTLHKLVPSPHGHPNFVLPVGIAIPKDEAEKADQTSTPDGDDPMFSLFKTTKENERAAVREKKTRSFPHLVFQPSPFVLQKFLPKKKSDFDPLESPTVLSAWFHDMVSALVHCHSNNILLRTLQPDQVIVDHSGVAKLSGLYRAIAIAREDRRHPPNIVKLARELKKKGGSKKEEEDSSVTPFTPPEILLGSPKFTKESDVWTLGCLLANILLSKTPFVGKDRQSLLTAMYKIVGIPSQKNFEDAARFPHYVKPAKKYRRDVEKAMEHMLKSEHAPKYKKAIDLIACMLHLDPSERITAEEALNHEFLKEYRQNIERKVYREDYVAEWMAMKSKLISASKYTNNQSDQRRAMMLASATGADNNDDDGDGLYDFEL